MQLDMSMTTNLIPFDEDFIPEIMSWVDSEQACRLWAGSWFEYPFNRQSFSRDCRWQDLPTYVLQDDNGQLLAFGQYYNRLDCCHLARLIVSPKSRGAGIGKQLVAKLVSYGSGELKLQRASLFVLKSNPLALALYEKLGFRISAYPEPEEGLEICHYMVAPVSLNES
ncbi:GNAT family N-acetyltransferase [Microbulbifer elongatus]|uniref:GNAT family N-acetyltransferase n=1 Tax=Microbulbifer elongatus TaxID=86173 RepID=UPI001CFC6911|nr:GNAT family N-acetyltransferase [Microbulbifer elongatus]